jgi:hypothetical protein
MTRYNPEAPRAQILAIPSELPQIGLEDALAILLALLDREPQAFRHAGARWGARVRPARSHRLLGESLSSLLSLRSPTATWRHGRDGEQCSSRRGSATVSLRTFSTRRASRRSPSRTPRRRSTRRRRPARDTRRSGSTAGCRRKVPRCLWCGLLIGRGPRGAGVPQGAGRASVRRVSGVRPLSFVRCR